MIIYASIFEKSFILCINKWIIQFLSALFCINKLIQIQYSRYFLTKWL